jgi:hypothetical protein
VTANDRFVEIVRAPRRGTFRAGGQPVRRGGRPPLPLAGRPVRGRPARAVTKGVIALGFASSERGAGRGGQAGVSAPASIPGDPRHLGLGKTSTVRAAGRNQASVGRLEAREAIRSRAGPVDDRRCSASIRVGLWRHRAQADSELFRPVRPASSDASRVAPKELLGAVPLAVSVPRRGSEERRNGELRARNGRSLGVPVFCEKWLQKSASGVGPKKPFSVAAESGGQGLARRGESAMGEGAS